MMTSEKQKYVQLESVLHKRVIGQNEAVKVVSDAIRRNKAGLNDPNIVQRQNHVRQVVIDHAENDRAVVADEGQRRQTQRTDEDRKSVV